MPRCQAAHTRSTLSAGRAIHCSWAPSLKLDPSALLCWGHQELLVQRGEAGPESRQQSNPEWEAVGGRGAGLWALLPSRGSSSRPLSPHHSRSILFRGVSVGESFFRGRICSWALPLARVASRLSPRQLQAAGQMLAAVPLHPCFLPPGPGSCCRPGGCGSLTAGSHSAHWERGSGQAGGRGREGRGSQLLWSMPPRTSLGWYQACVGPCTRAAVLSLNLS